VEYFDQMDKDEEYPLRVGLLSLPHLEGVTGRAQVRMEPVAIPAQTAEPVVRVVPSSTFFRISPAARELRTSKEGDTFTTFKVMPVQVPKTLSSTCELEIDFEYRSAVIHTMRIPVRVVEKRRFGPVCISHRYWLPFGLVGALINLLTIVSGLIQFFNYMPSPLESAVYTGGIALGSFVLVFGYILWRGAGRRRSRDF
jgi:hypothetical protein